jgi:CRAL/TRIO domain
MTRLPAGSADIGHQSKRVHHPRPKERLPAKNYLSEAGAIGQYYYSECMGKFYIINALYLFSTVCEFTKHGLNEVAVKKIKIISTGHKAVLMAQIDEANLLDEFGGMCKCAGGCSLSDEGPWKRHSTSATQTSIEALVEPDV